MVDACQAEFAHLNVKDTVLTESWPKDDRPVMSPKGEAAPDIILVPPDGRTALTVVVGNERLVPFRRRVRMR